MADAIAAPAHRNAVRIKAAKGPNAGDFWYRTFTWADGQVDAKMLVKESKGWELSSVHHDNNTPGTQVTMRLAFSSPTDPNEP